MDLETKRRVRKALKPYLKPPYILQYRGASFPLNFDPRKGICSQCSKKIGDPYINHKGEHSKIKMTQLHHLKYDDDHPLDNTIELCDSCHSKLTIKQTHIPLKECLEIFITTGKDIGRRRMIS
jgi:hypothetical protein